MSKAEVITLLLPENLVIPHLEYGADSVPLHAGETPPGVLHPTPESSVQERHGPVGAGPEEVHKNDQRDGTPLL